MKRLQTIIEKSLVGLIILMFSAQFLYWGGSAASIFRHRKKTRSAKAKMSAPAGIWPKDIAEAVNEDFIFRQELIQGANELFYRAWKVCPATTAGITVGKESVLYEASYLVEYCLTRTTTEALAPLVEKIKRFQDICDRSGIKFALLITPSKAAIQPDYIPDDWKTRYDSRPRAYDLFVPLLKKSGVRYVDGHAITQRLKEKATAPIFPKGGTHWSYYGASFTVNALLDCLREQGEKVSHLQTTPLRISNEPEGTDKDLVQLMNLAVPWRYPVSDFDIKPADATIQHPRNLCFIGGSFVWQVATELQASKQFSEINAFFYYKLFKSTNPTMKGHINPSRDPTGEVDFEHEIFANDCLVLEINESIIASQKHLDAFLADAFSHMPRGEVKRETFHYESAYPCIPGQTITLQSGTESPRILPWLSGFSAATPAGAWADSGDSIIKLRTPKHDGNLVLTTTLRAFIDSTLCPEQIVDVLANGVLVGQWKFTSEEITQKQLVIPKQCFSKEPFFELGFKVHHRRKNKNTTVLISDVRLDGEEQPEASSPAK